MIDIEIPLFNEVYTAVKSAYPNCAVLNDRPQSLAQFPAVVLTEDDNYTYRSSRDLGDESYAQVMYQLDVYTDNQRNGKTLCKAIASVVDSVLTNLRFERMSFSPMPNQDPNIIRYTGRYRAVVSKAVNHGTDGQGLPELQYYIYRR